MSDVAIKVESLSVDYPSAHNGSLRVLNGLDIEIKRGAFVAILGPSGSGKTTLLRCLSGLHKPNSGRIRLDLAHGKEDSSLPPVSMNFQRPVLLPWLSVTENAYLPFRIRGIKIDNKVERRLYELLATVGLLGFRHAKPFELSGGMQMRAALVRTFLTSPQLVLMDEPFAALDEVTRHHLGSSLLQLWKTDRCTVVFVTHNIQEAIYLSDRVLVLSMRPAKVIADIEVSLERPRLPSMREDKTYNDLVKQLYELMRHE